MGSLIVARSRNQWGGIVVDVACPCDESHRLGDVARRSFKTKLKWVAFCIIRDQSLSDLHRGTGFLGPETDRPKSPSGPRNGLRVKAFLRSGPPYAILKTPIFAHCFGWT